MEEQAMHEKERLTQANAFRTLSRADAQLAFPELRAAYATVDALRKVAVSAQPADARVAQRVDLAIRNHVADRVQSGASLSLDAQTREAARLEVAFANLQHAADARRVKGDQGFQLAKEERSHLIQAAQDAASGKLSRFGLSEEPASSRAMQVARELSGVDYPARNNPFQVMQLRDLYQRDADYREIMEVGPTLRGLSLS
jgi:hypothetical protein